MKHEIPWPLYMALAAIGFYIGFWTIPKMIEGEPEEPGHVQVGKHDHTEGPFFGTQLGKRPWEVEGDAGPSSSTVERMKERGIETIRIGDEVYPTEDVQIPNSLLHEEPVKPELRFNPDIGTGIIACSYDREGDPETYERGPILDTLSCPEYHAALKQMVQDGCHSCGTCWLHDPCGQPQSLDPHTENVPESDP